MIPVHPEDHPLLGVRWGNSCYIDGMLPFGLRSAPKLLTAVVDALEGQHITFLELLVHVQCGDTGGKVTRCSVGVITERQCVVWTLGCCRDPGLMHLLRCLFFLEASLQFELVARHIPGSHNTIADDSTQKTYQVGVNCYSQFCNSYGAVPFPVSESLLCYHADHHGHICAAAA